MSLPRFQPTLGRPCVFAPMETGLAIEDIWPSLYIGADRVEEMKRKIGECEWARKALDRWREEAEVILPETPGFSLEPSAGRCGMYTDAGHYLQFDPHQPAPVWDPVLKRYVQPSERARKASVTLRHERIRRLMVSLGFLWRLTGEERFADWAREGLRQSIDLYRTAGDRQSRLGHGNSNWGVVYGGLYEAQAMLTLLQTSELVCENDGERQRLIDTIFVPVGERLSAWMDRMIVHNMSCWSMAALAEIGRFAARPDWIEKAFHSERCGLRKLLEIGVPRHPETGRPDGFWFEHSHFYGCFYVATSLIPLYRAAEKAGVLDDDLRERFASLFDAPPHITDSNTRLLTISDRSAPDKMRITQMHYLYEYAAGRLDDRHAPFLAWLYDRCGAPRVSLAAIAFGPDELPPPTPPDAVRRSCALPEAQLAVFRAETARGAATLWFANLKRYAGSAQGHHHMDKLSISLHACGEVITSDLGWPGLESDETRAAFLSGTLSHNALMLNEYDQGTVGAQSFETHLDAPVPWARGSFRGDSDDKLWATFRDHHHGRLQEGLYDDAAITRTVWFDWPRIVLLDQLEADTDKRFGFVFHARGLFCARPPAAEGAPLAMPPLPHEGAWRHFADRAVADPVRLFVADWRLRADLYLSLTAASDGPFDAHWGATPDNPSEILRGTVLLRAPGRRRRFVTVLHVHEGTPRLAGVAPSEEGVVTRDYDGARRAYKAEP